MINPLQITILGLVVFTLLIPVSTLALLLSAVLTKMIEPKAHQLLQWLGYEDKDTKC